MSLIIACMNYAGVKMIADPLATNGFGSPQHLLKKIRSVNGLPPGFSGYDALAVGVTGNIGVLRIAEKAVGGSVLPLSDTVDSVRYRMEDVALSVDDEAKGIEEFWQLVVIGRTVSGSFFMAHIQQRAGLVNFQSFDPNDPSDDCDPWPEEHAKFIVAGAGEDYVRGWIDGRGVPAGHSIFSLSASAMRAACRVIPALSAAPYLDIIGIDKSDCTISTLSVTD